MADTFDDSVSKPMPVQAWQPHQDPRIDWWGFDLRHGADATGSGAA